MKNTQQAVFSNETLHINETPLPHLYGLYAHTLITPLFFPGSHTPRGGGGGPRCDVTAVTVEMSPRSQRETRVDAEGMWRDLEK